MPSSSFPPSRCRRHRRFSRARLVGRALDVRQWALLFAFSLGVYLGANLAQQLAIRQLGPALVSSLMPSRLLSSVAGSYLLLGEGITSAIEGVGLLVVALSSAGYLGRQVLARRAAG